MAIERVAPPTPSRSFPPRVPQKKSNYSSFGMLYALRSSFKRCHHDVSGRPGMIACTATTYGAPCNKRFGSLYIPRSLERTNKHQPKTTADCDLNGLTGSPLKSSSLRKRVVRWWVVLPKLDASQGQSAVLCID